MEQRYGKTQQLLQNVRIHYKMWHLLQNVTFDDNNLFLVARES